MAGYKNTKEEFSAEQPLKRFKKLKWWFLLLIVVGFGSLFFVLGNQLEDTYSTINKQLNSLDLLPISAAYAQDSIPLEGNEITMRVIIMSGIFLVLAIVYLAGIIKLFFTKNADQADAAADLVKTMTGFFVGAATGFLG